MADETYECQRSGCNRTFSQPSNRSRHQKICTKGEVLKPKTTFECQNIWCKKSFSRSNNLTRHLLVCTPKEKSEHVCMHPDCNKTFDKLSKLLRHQLSHTKPTYSCERCSSTYSRHDKFVIHQKKCEESTIHAPRPSVLHPRPSMIDPQPSMIDPQPSMIDPQPSVVDAQPSMIEPEPSMIEPEPSMIDAQRGTLHEGGECSSSFVDEINHSIGSMDTPEVYVVDDMYSMFDDISYMNFVQDSPVYSKFEYESDIASCTLKHLKMLRHQGKRSSVKLQEFSKLCVLLYKNKFDDLNFMDALADDLGFQNRDEFKDYINTNKSTIAKRGRPMNGVEERQVAYDFWKDHSNISNNRRNARHVIKIKPTKRDRAVTDLHDDRVKECQTKGGLKYKAQKHIYNDTVRELYREFKSIHSQLNISPSLFYRCKPFYISPATEREMEACLCSKCLNPHALYTTLRRSMKGLPESLSEYLTMYFECSKNGHINFPKVDCLKGTCKNNCSITDESEKSTDCWDKKVSFYQFETVEESYNNKAGEKKFYRRTARKDYKDQTVRHVYQLLQDCARNYLLHRYHTLLDKVYWQRYLEETDAAVVWMDYSQNIKLTEKNQAQSAHFSGKQQTLHDSLIQYKGSYRYVYHLSNDTNHDSVLTTEIVSGNISNHPQIIETGKLVLRSDNCATQYKSRFVFKLLLNLAKKHNIRIDFFYGEAGHGRGLIDAMAWFGCKGPMRKEIVAHDSWFENADKMHEFLSKHFENDPSKEYYLIHEDTTAAYRKKGREERRIVGCSAAHVISFHPDGHTFSKWATVKDFLERNEVENEDVPDNEVENETEADEEVEDEEVAWIGSIEDFDLYKMIEKDSFVAIRAEPGSLELFHIMKVEEKKIATENIKDSSEEHCVLHGEPYLLGKWFSFQKETKKFACFKESQGTELALIHIFNKPGDK